MRLPKRTRERNGQIDYFIEIPIRGDIVDRLIEEYGPDYATWSAAANQMGSDALSFRSYEKKRKAKAARKSNPTDTDFDGRGGS